MSDLTTIELRVRVEAPPEPSAGDDPVTLAMYELADLARLIVERHGLTYAGAGYGVLPPDPAARRPRERPREPEGWR